MICGILAAVVLFGGPKGEDLIIDGRPVQLRSGEIHPQRIPREYWRRSVKCAKAMGLNAVGSYFMWNDFERPDGSFDFRTERRDVAAFLQICKEEGLYVLFRPGPYVCGEWDFGGLPPRLLRRPGCLIRTSKNPDYQKEAERYMTAIAKVAEPYLAKNGGPIVLTQLENEYGSWPDRDPGHVVWLKNTWKKLGFGPFYMSDGPSDRCLKGLSYPDREIAVGLDSGRNEGDWNVARKWNPGVPILSGETYPGWLRHWGEGDWRPNDLRETLAWYMREKKSFNLFMFHGGTSFGFRAGANDGGSGHYRPDVTSYDYASPLNERGTPTERYFQYREILGGALGGVGRLPAVPDPIPTMAIAPFVPAFFADLRDNVTPVAKEPEPMWFEHYGQNQGMGFYRTAVPAGPEAELVFERLADFAKILVDGRLVATLERRLGQRSVKIPARANPATLEVAVEAMGHVNYGRCMRDDRKGVFGKVTLDGAELKGWALDLKPMTEETVAAAKPGKRRPDAFGGHFRGTFTLAGTADTYFDMSRWGKGTLYVNGRNLGRYWKIGPQLSLYCPASWLKAGENRVDVLDLECAGPQPIRGVPENVGGSDVKRTENLNNAW